MKTKFLAVLLLAGTSMFARTHFSIGVGIGPAYPYYYAPPPIYYAPAPYYYAPSYPYVVGGYWGPVYRSHWGRHDRHGYYYRGYWRR